MTFCHLRLAGSNIASLRYIRGFSCGIKGSESVSTKEQQCNIGCICQEALGDHMGIIHLLLRNKLYSC